MPAIPGLPTLDPVSKPYMSPAEAGRGGAAIAQTGETIEDNALDSLQLEAHMRKAQQHVDSLAAGNELNAAVEQTKVQLAKTQNSRDVPAVLKAAQDNLNEISNRWSKSPAAISIQMDADSLRPHLDEVSQMRGIALMSDEFKINLTTAAKPLATEYANSRAAGDANGESAALGAFSQAVKGGVDTGLIGDAEAQLTVQKFREQGQELQIRNAIANPDPSVNQAMFDKINSDPKAFPDVTAENLDVFKAHAQEAMESHIKHQEWAEGQMAQNTMLRPLIQLHTNSGTGSFDEGAALTDINKQFSDGKITAYQQQVLANGVKAVASDQTVAAKQQAGKIMDEVDKAFKDHKFGEGFKKLEEARPYLERSGLTDDYRSMLRYGDQMQREQRTENREYAAEAKRQVAEQSQTTLAQTLNKFSQGYVYSDSQIDGMAGNKPGEMTTADVAIAKKYSHDYQNSPAFRSAVDMISDNLPLGALPKNATPEQREQYAQTHPREAKIQADTYAAFLEEKNKHPEMDPVAVAKQVLQPATQKVIADKVNQLFTDAPKPGVVDRLRQGQSDFRSGNVVKAFGEDLGSLLGFGLSEPAKSETPVAPKEGDKKKNSAGDPVVFSGGKWGPDASAN